MAFSSTSLMGPKALKVIIKIAEGRKLLTPHKHMWLVITAVVSPAVHGKGHASAFQSSRVEFGNGVIAPT